MDRNKEIQVFLVDVALIVPSIHEPRQEKDDNEETKTISYKDNIVIFNLHL